MEAKELMIGDWCYIEDAELKTGLAMGINDEELDKLALKAYPDYTYIDCFFDEHTVSREQERKAFKAGYRKAMDTLQDYIISPQ